MDSILNITPLQNFSLGAQIGILAGGGLVLAIVLNVLSQLLLPQDRSLPPLVFHYVPIIGSAVTYGIDPYKFFFDCREKYGDVFTFVLLGRKVTVALGAKGNNLILNGKLSHVSAEAAYTHLTTPVFGKEVVFDVPNHVLMEQKKFVKVGLSTENMRVYVDQIVDEVSKYIATDKNFGPLASGKEAKVDIFKSMSEITILTASRTLQGREVRENLDKSFAQLYHDLDSGFTPINFVIPNLPLPGNFKRDRAQLAMSRFYQGIIQSRRKAGADGAADLDEEHDMIAALMQQSYKNGRPLSDVEIAHMMIALLMAGQHTSSATGSWALLRLASKPALVEELYAEQQQVWGEELRPLDYETLKSSTPLLDAVIRETLRLHPPLHSLMRKVMSPMTVPPTYASPSSSSRGSSSKAGKDDAAYVIPAGHYVMAAPGVSQVDPHIWANADEFDPKRWLDPTSVVAQQERDDAEAEKVDFGWGAVSSGANSPYLPFGAGRHRCIGEQFAYLQLGTIISTFVRKFQWKLVHGFPDPDYTSMVVLPKHGDMVITPRAA
ncbi:Lanosterol 14-alpha-demethylase [Tilletia horrida]|uniref:Lanosterol 14-alpha-demethylase n=1 Tax=Tilletia horrida TaxID=155126 RepID=A0AAN6GN04_9BASI|nr:Lanosterol 14-alpha-demethylase [Tilletia horrida]KAK0551380.1 Lanosterol 14-alpha-demethylase [Tilletia horrida]KAK0558569.1 Lanosterol 14-alpha-demethylase [Tilletia horrida]WJY55479.1 lanosterol 14-alpha demethylase [Tilletia horrida]WJY55480.1 lanosterol 14-alpha demethylase [Tilletia horrida]